jgi:hypothetical protein
MMVRISIVTIGAVALMACERSNPDNDLGGGGGVDMSMATDQAWPGSVDMATSTLADFSWPGPDPCKMSPITDGWDSSCGTALGGNPSVMYHCYKQETIWADPCPAGCHVSPPGKADYCEAPAGPAPPKGNGGKGLWIWDMNTPNNPRPPGHAPDPQTIADLCVSLGIGFVLIKSGEDEAYWDWNFSAATIKPFLDKNIEVYAWPYVRPGGPHFGTTQSHVDAALKAATIRGVKGIILDVEEEFKRTYTYSGDPPHDPHITYGPEATALCKGIRAGLPPGVILGYSTFGWIYYNTSFPFKEFDSDCGDAFLPQTYYIVWSGITPQKAYDIGCGGALGIGLKAPCWAAQDNCEGSGQESTQNMIDFFEIAGDRATMWRMYNDSEAAPCSVTGKTLNDQFKAITNWKNN